jgi:hypothetical protein
MMFDRVPRIICDQTRVFTDSDQVHRYSGVISNAAKPFQVTLAWTDAPGSIVGKRDLVNNLDLVVNIGGQRYLGNVFKGEWSSTGGTPDQLNNVESVFLPPGATGRFVIDVIGTCINGYGVPGDPHPNNQDYALIIYNAVSE